MLGQGAARGSSHHLTVQTGVCVAPGLMTVGIRPAHSLWISRMRVQLDTVNEDLDVQPHGGEVICWAEDALTLQGGAAVNEMRLRAPSDSPLVLD